MNRRSFLRFALLAIASVPVLKAEKVAEVFAPLEEVGREYYGIEWPIVTRDWKFGVYTEEILNYHMSYFLNRDLNL